MEFIFYFIFDSSVFSQGFNIIITMSVALYSNKVSLSFRHKIKWLFTVFVRQFFFLFWNNTLIVQKHITTLLGIVYFFFFCCCCLFKIENTNLKGKKNGF